MFTNVRRSVAEIPKDEALNLNCHFNVSNTKLTKYALYM